MQREDLNRSEPSQVSRGCRQIHPERASGLSKPKKGCQESSHQEIKFPRDWDAEILWLRRGDCFWRKEDEEHVEHGPVPYQEKDLEKGQAFGSQSSQPWASLPIHQWQQPELQARGAGRLPTILRLLHEGSPYPGQLQRHLAAWIEHVQGKCFQAASLIQL